MNYLLAVFSENPGVPLGGTKPDEDILFRDGYCTVYGVGSRNLSVYEDDNVFLALTGIVYRDVSDECKKTDAEYVYLDFVNSNSAAYGHYVIICYDKNLQTTTSFGDRKSGRKVFYFQEQGYCGVSSKLKIIVDKGLVGRERNNDFEKFALIYGYFPGENTIYKGIQRTRKNELVDVSSCHSLSVSELLTPPPKYLDTTVGELSQVKDKLYESLLRVTEESLMGSDSVAVLLGGFDSALMASLAVRLGKRVKGYTFKYASAEHNQKNVDSVIEALGIEHEWVEIDSDVIKSGYENYSDYFDRPTNWPNYVMQTNYLTSKIVRDGFTKCITGDGCDEIFLGYPGIYRGAKVFSREYRGLGGVIKSLKRILESSYLERKLGHVYRLAHRLLSNLSIDRVSRLYYMFRILDESTLKSLFSWDKKSVRAQVASVMDSYRAELGKFSDTILAYEGRENIIPNRLKITGAMDAYDVSIYSPFMHPEVRDYVRAIPESMLRPSGEGKRDSLGKYVLLEMAVEKDLLPANVVYQPKHAAVDGPLDRWYDEEIRSTLTGLISNIDHVGSSRFLNSLLEEKAIEKLYKKHLSVDSISSHAASLLSTYGSFFR